MGIYYFNSYISRRFSTITKKYKNEDVASLFLDMNGIFHNAANAIMEEYPNLSYIKLEKAILDAIIDELIKIIKFYRPKKNLVITPDGVANAAKFQQQKYRRFKDKENNEKFDRRVITPGTNFMFKLDDRIQEMLADRNNRYLLPSVVIYSSHLVEGEGEHKIFQLIRENEIIYDRNDKHILWGRDSDLIHLSALSKLNNILLVQEDFATYIDIEEYKKLILNDLKLNNINKKIYDKNLLVDFLIIMSMLGNDFLFRFPSFTDLDEIVNIGVDIYRKLGTYICDYKNDKYIINKNNYLKFLENFHKQENKLFLKLYLRKGEFNCFNEIKTCGKILSKTENNIDFEINYEKFDDEWYIRIFGPKNLNFYKTYKKIYDQNDIDNVCHNYFDTLNWLVSYYTNGYKKVNNLTFYRYPFSPTIHSLINYLRSNDNIKLYYDDIPQDITCIHQLLCVLPSNLINIIPPSFRETYNLLRQLIPENFTVINENIKKDYEAYPYIPPINILLVFYLLRDIKIPGKYKNRKEIISKKIIPRKKIEIKSLENKSKNPLNNKFKNNFIKDDLSIDINKFIM